MVARRNIISGVYVITNSVNGKSYVGSASRGFAKRWYRHLLDLKRNAHDNYHLQCSWNKHGESAFTFSVLEVCAPEDCIAREQHYIDTMRVTRKEFGYNICPTAGSRLGTKLSQDQIEVIRAAQNKPETREKKAAYRRGKKNSQEVRNKISESNKIAWSDPIKRSRLLIGVRNVSEERRKKQSESGKRKWRNPVFLAGAGASIIEAIKTREVTDETKLKMSDSAILRVSKPEELKKLQERAVIAGLARDAAMSKRLSNPVEAEKFRNRMREIQKLSAASKKRNCAARMAIASI